MRTMLCFWKRPIPRSLFAASALGLCALSAGAASYTNDFNANPASDPNLIIRPTAGGATWRNTGSHDNSGYMSLTDAANSQNGTLVLPDLNPGNQITSFKVVAKVRIGGGTARPADGMSISFGDDPGGDVSEEGTLTGLALSIDTYQNETIVNNVANGNGEAPTIELKWDNVVVARKRFAGDAHTAGPGYLLPERDANGAPIAIQTDPAGTGTGGTPVWTDLEFSISGAGAATVRYKGIDIFKDVVIPGWAPRSGRFVIGGRTGGLNEAHWIDNIGLTTEVGDAPPQFTSTTPAANPAVHQPEFTPVSFVINEGISFEDVDRNTIRLTVGGQDVTTDPGTQIQFDTPNQFEITVTYTPGGLGYPPGSRQEAVLTYSTMAGTPFTARKEMRITEVPAMTDLGPPLFIEAEDFNYSEGGIHGQFFDFGSPHGSYSTKAAQHDVDYHLGNGGNPENREYRVLDPPNGIAANGDSARAGGIVVSPNYKVGWNDANDAFNYTRTFPNNTYKIYGRFSSGQTDVLNSFGRATISRVVSNPAEGNQAILDVGFFDFPSTGGWDTFIGFQPLRDSTGKDLVVRLNGLTTLRLTTRPGAYDVNYLAFVPTFTTNVTLPTSTISPANGAETRVRDNFTIRAIMLDGDTQVVPGSVRLFFDGVLQAATVTDTAPGAEAQIAITSSPQFGPHTARVIFSDNSAVPVSFTNTVTFTVSPLKSGPDNNLFIEAEDFNYSDDGLTGGLHANFGGPDCPTLNKDGILGVDYFEVNDGQAGGTPAYRPQTGVEAAKPGGDGLFRGDQTITCTYIIGWTDNGDWYNYTRDFGASARYNVFLRAASGGGNESAEFARITSDPAQPNQTKEVVGQFNSPPTGAWDTFHFVPLRDAAGTMVNARLSGLQTFRLTKQPADCDFNYLAFVKADVQFFPPTLQAAFPLPNSQNAAGTIRAVVQDQDSQVVASSLRLLLNGIDVTSSATVTDTAGGAEISLPIGANPLGSTHMVRVEWADNQPSPTNGFFQWQFTDYYNGGRNLFIEAEDFNTASGDFLPSKPGGAPFNQKNLYNTLGATANIDYFDTETNVFSNIYRTEGVDNLPHVDIIATPDTTAGPRQGFETTPDYKIGWTDPGPPDWYNYTRDYAAGGNYQIYIRASHGDGAMTIGGALDLLDDPTVPTSTNRVGTFRAPATGGWDTFTFIPLRDTANQILRVPLAGVQTLRYTVQANGGDINYLMLAPVTVGPQLSITRSGNNVTITWPSGNLQSAPAITGPWANETGATSPLQLNNTTGMRFYRSITP